MNGLSGQRIILAAVLSVLLLGIGYGIYEAPADWTPLLLLTLPIVVTMLAVLGGRVFALASSALSTLLTIPYITTAARTGTPPEMLTGILSAAACLITGQVTPTLASVKRLHTFAKHRLAQASTQLEVAKIILDEALRVTSADVGQVLLIRENGVLDTIVSRDERRKAPEAVTAPLSPAGYTVAKRALQEERPYVAPNLYATEDEPTTIAAVPLKGSNGTIGAICIGNRDGKEIDRETPLLLQTLATEGANALQRTDIQGVPRVSFERRMEELAVLEEIARTIGSSLELGVILEAILSSAKRLIAFDMAEITLWDSEMQCLVSASALDTADYRAEVGPTYQLNEGFTGWLARHRRPLRIDSIPSRLDVRPLLDHPDYPFRSFLGVPIEKNQEFIGTLEVISFSDSAFSRHDQELLETISLQAAMAIENARLYARIDSELERRAVAISGLQRVSWELGATFDQDHLLQLVMEEALQSSKAEHCTILLRDPILGAWQIAISSGYTKEELDTLERDLGYLQDTTKIVEVALSGESTRISPIRPDELVLRARKGTRSVLLAPIWYANAPVGLILLGDNTRNAFDAQTQGFVDGMAAQAALAIGNHRRYQEQLDRNNLLSARAEQLRHILEVTQSARSDHPLEDVLEDTAYAVQEAVGFDLVTISVLEGTPPHLQTIASAGLPIDIAEQVKATPQPWDTVHEQLRDEYRKGQTYYIPESQQPEGGLHGMLNIYKRATSTAPSKPGQWHPNDLLFVRLMGSTGELLGLICVDEPRDGLAPNSSTIEVLEIFAAQAAANIENTRLYKEIRRFNEELEQRVKERTQELAAALEDLTAERDRVETLYRIASELSVSLDLDYVLNQTLNMIVNAVGAERGAILFYNQEKDRLVYRAALGAEFDIPPGGRETRLGRGQGLAWWVIENGEAVLVDDLSQDHRWVPDQKKDGFHRACLAAPLGAASDIQGALLLYNSAVGYFTDDHLRLVKAAGSQISNTLRNASLYKLVSDQAGQLGSMLKQQQVEAAKSKAVLESVADGVIVTDAYGRVILFNAAAARILQVDRDQVLDQSIEGLLSRLGTEGQAWLKAIEKCVLEPEARVGGDFVAERLETESQVVSIHVGPVVMRGEYLGAVSVLRDITAEVQTARAKSEFVAMVSHELRTPMTSIKGYADLLMMGAVGPLNEEQKHFIDIVRSNADRLTALVNDILDISRIEAGRIELYRDEVSISEAVQQVTSMLEGRAHDKQISMSFDLPDDLPTVWGDNARLIQIIINLMSNAIKYTPEGGSITVSARPIQDTEMVEVSVQDTGIGISEENLQNLFAAFFRADDPMVQENVGTGLGLSITASLVQLHGGEIWVTSELGKGSTFAFTVPFYKDIVPPPPLILTPSHILVVEDSEDVADLIRIHLESEGHQVTTTHLGSEVVRLAEEIKPGLITLDIQLPDKDGFAVLQELKSHPSLANIPVVIVSVLPCKEDGLRFGAVGYVTKPIKEDKLLNAVRRGLDPSDTILAVDDDADNLRLMRDALKKQGLNVRTTRSGRRALRVAREAQPALILLDMRLEDMDGYQVMNTLKTDSLTWDIPIVVMTGSLTQEELDQDGVATIGAANLITKPFSVEELFQEIATALTNPE